MPGGSQGSGFGARPERAPERADMPNFLDHSHIVVSPARTRRSEATEDWDAHSRDLPDGWRRHEPSNRRRERGDPQERFGASGRRCCFRRIREGVLRRPMMV